jgi:S1-C subfamily serine protease
MQEQFVWNCSSCGRQVPRRVEVCRCGFRQPEAGIVTAAEREPAAAGRARPVLLLVAALCVGLALAAIPWRAIPPPDAPPVGAQPPGAQPQNPETRVPGSDPVSLAPPEVAASLAAPAPLITPPTTTPAATLEDVVAAALPAVAAIQAGNARGTGFFVRPDTVLTNAHVVGGNASVQLQVGPARYTARVVSSSTATDLAVLQVFGASSAQPTLRLGTVANARVGQEVLAIGSALGVLSNTVTRGIVSAVRRAGDVTLVQTDAAINPGNSGGPLIDREGRVIGINTMKAFAGAESIGFAVAIDHASGLLNGQRGASTHATPATGLDTMLRHGESAAGAPTPAEDARARGEQMYDSVLGEAAQRGASIDAYWDQYARECVTASVNAGDRRWMAALETNGVRLAATNTRSRCSDWLETVATNAGGIDQAIRQANERARRAGVFPGVLRDLRRRHRLDWPGWDR